MTLATKIFMPSSLIQFGVLTLLGSSMLLMIPLEKVLGKVRPLAGFMVSLGLFILTRNVNGGSLGFEGINVLQLPKEWYTNLFTAYLGFPYKGFYQHFV